jgi:hypothetical protein
MRAAWTAFLVLVACGARAESQPPASIPSDFSHEPHRQTASEDVKSGKRSRAGDQQPTVTVTASPSINLEAGDEKRQLDKNSSVEWWSIGVSLAVLVVASLQLLTYRRQAKLMAERANIMKSSVDLQRPIVYGKISKPGWSVSPHGGLLRGILELSIDNIGATPANLTRIEWGVFVAPHGEIAPAIDPVIAGGRELPIGPLRSKENHSSRLKRSRCASWTQKWKSSNLNPLCG